MSYIPEKIPGPPPYWQRLLYAGFLILAALIGPWAMAVLLLSLERVAA